MRSVTPPDGATGERGAPIRVAVVDDHDVVHAGIEAWFGHSLRPIEVVRTFSDADPDLPELIGEVDVVVLDLLFDGGRPELELLRGIVAAGHRVVVYSMTTDPATILECLELGAMGYLTKAEGRDHLVAAVRAAADQTGYIGPSMAGAMADDRQPRRPRLSPREMEVLLHWFRTESKELVGAALFITPATVNTHLARIRAKYAAAGRPATTKAALIARALQDGIVTLEELELT